MFYHVGLAQKITGNAQVFFSELRHQPARHFGCNGLGLLIKKKALLAQEEVDGLTNVLLCFFAEPFVQGKSILVAGIQQFAQGFNLHLLPDDVYFFGPDSLDLQHLQHAFGRVGYVLFQKLHSSAVQQFTNFLSHAFANAPNASYGFWIHIGKVGC